MKRLCALTLATALAAAAQPALAQEPPHIELREHLTRGDAIHIELKSGRRVTGTVGDKQWDGFWVEHPPEAASFVGFRDAQLVLDPDTGETLGVVAHDRDGLPRWAVVSLVTAAVVVGGFVVATKGLFPLCLFLRCD